MSENVNRRSFLKFSLAGVTAIPLLLKTVNAFAADACPAVAPAGKSIASPNEGMGKGLEYVTDAKTTKNPAYKAGMDCGNCKFYNAAKAEAGFAPCTMMGNKYVTTCGWCKSYKAKA